MTDGIQKRHVILLPLREPLVCDFFFTRITRFKNNLYEKPLNSLSCRKMILQRKLPLVHFLFLALMVCIVVLHVAILAVFTGLYLHPDILTL